MSVTDSVMQIARQVAVTASGGDTTGIAPPTDPNEMSQLGLVIKTWREIRDETDQLSSTLREKRKRKLALEEMILRIMKKNNIGALDLKSSGGRILYSRQNTKGSMNQKDMMRHLADHLQSEEKATGVIKYLTEHRGTKLKESLRFEKD